MLKANKKVILILLLTVVLNIQNGWAQEEKTAPRTVSMTIFPMGESVPALKHSLLPKFLDQKQGNALPIYQMAQEAMPIRDLEMMFFDGQAEAWEKQLPDKEAVKKLKDSLSLYDNAFKFLAIGALREDCRWDLPLRELGMAIDMLIPGLGDYNALGKRLRVKIRLQTLENDYPGALKSLQTGLASAKHMAEGGTLVHDLIGMAIADSMLQGVEYFVQAKEAPNLYWALASLDTPLIDIRYAIGAERVLTYLQFPALRNPQSKNLTRKEIMDIYGQLIQYVSTEEELESYARQFEQLKESAIYGDAKKRLKELGYTEQKIESMEPLQTVLIYQLDEYDRLSDDMHKWFRAPYWQARQPLKKMEEILAEKTQDREKFWGSSLFFELLPALDRVYLRMAKVDRQIAMLRCVEAIRMYTADHQGRTPKSLTEITKVPIPIDPVTGKDFIYKVEGQKITIDGPPPPGADPTEGLRYELIINK